MAHSQSTHEAVRRSYVRGLSLADAAAKNKVAIGTAKRWKKDSLADGDDWDAAQAARQLTASHNPELVSEMTDNFVYLYHRSVTSLRLKIESQDDETFDPFAIADTLSKLADAYTKTMSAIVKGQPHLNKLSIALDVVEEFTTFIKNHHPDELAHWAGMLEPFAAHLNVVMSE